MPAGYIHEKIYANLLQLKIHVTTDFLVSKNKIIFFSIANVRLNFEFEIFKVYSKYLRDFIHSSLIAGRKCASRFGN